MILANARGIRVMFKHPLQHTRRDTIQEMSNAQLFVAAGLPTAASLASIAVALILDGRLETRMESINIRLESRMDVMNAHLEGRIELLASRIDRLAADLSQFYMVLGRHHKAIETLEKK
jgi:hypothetical protein